MILYVGENHILRLDISVEDGVVVHLFEAEANLLHLLSSLFLFQLFILALFEVAKKTPSFHVLHYDIEVCVIIEKPIKLHYLWVIEEHLYFYLAHELF